MNLKKELQVGVLFLVAIILLVIFTITISRFNVFTKYHYLTVTFDKVSGLKKGDPVQVLGLEVGSVQHLEFQGDTQIKVILKLRRRIRIWEDYKIRIKESSMIGGNFVYIEPGAPGSTEHHPDDLLVGKAVPPGLSALAEFIEEHREDVESFLASSASLKKILTQIEEGKGAVGKLIFDPKLSQQVSDAGDSISKVLDPIVSTRVFAGIESKYYGESEMSISKFYIKIFPRPERYFLVGGSALSLDVDGDIKFEDKLKKRKRDQSFIKADVLFAYKLFNNRLTFRTGLLEGKFGGGIDFEIPITSSIISSISFTLEGRDAYNSVDDDDVDEGVSGALIRAYASATFWRHLTIYAGASRLFDDDSEFMAGICFEYKDEDIKNFITLIGLSGY